MKEIRIHCRKITKETMQHDWEDYCLHTQLFHNAKFISTDGDFDVYEYKKIKFKIRYGDQKAEEFSNVINILPFAYCGIRELTKLKNSNNWTPMIITGEKIFPVDLLDLLGTDKLPNYSYYQLEENIDKHKNTTFYTDQVNIENHEYKNKFILTNTLYFWNRKHNMTLTSEYHNLLQNINFEYRFGFCVNRVTNQRKSLAKELSSKKYCFVSQLKDHLSDYFNEISSNVFTNDLTNDIPFFNLSKTKFFFHLDMFEQDLDMFVRIYYKFEVHIIDETWAEYNSNFKTGNLTEKTIIPILFGSPFIATHIYPLQILDKIFSVGKHPLYDEILLASGQPNKIVNLVEKFNEDYKNNVIKCKEYSVKIREELIYRLKNENSLLEEILK